MDNSIKGNAKGEIYENIIAECLIKKGYKLYYYKPDDDHELEFLIEKEGGIVPIEVKAGNTSTVSLNNFINEYKPTFAYKFVSGNVGVVAGFSRHKKERYKNMNDVNNIISDFVDASINNGIAQEDGNANQANKYYRVIEKRKKWLIDHDELCNPDFLKLLNHENDYVRLHVSCALLHVKDREALNTLSYLSKKMGILGFTAEMTISEYKKGHI